MCVLQVSEIYYSIQGESSFRGEPCIFIRLTGCDLRCSWCDTEYSFYGGKKMNISKILNEVSRFPCKLVEITGGEPLLQKETPNLSQSLLNEGYTVLLETGGHKDIQNIPKEVITVMDIKTPSSGEAEKNNWDNLKYLKPHDEIKFVIQDRNDFEWAKKTVQEKLKKIENLIHFSPVFKKMNPHTLSKWILNENLPVKFGTQLHKELGLP
ncbi:MAG: radical SAM protein [Deltaproteobacteria bacterium]|nr:radical SAM protein [Deltaproteobacteria bacterium]